MTLKQNIDKELEQDLRRLQKFRLLDDDFMTKCFENDTACVELVLQIVLNKEDLKVEDVRTQVFVENLIKRSVRLDILATVEDVKKYNIEIQRADKGAGVRRARYNSSMMDANLLKKGEDFAQLPETYVIFITENDVMKKGLPLYSVERIIKETGEAFGDGAHILFVNGAYRSDTPLGKLMHDFSCTQPSQMNYEVLADRARYFKESKEGIAIMCKAMEDMRNQALEEGIKQGVIKGKIDVAFRMLKKGDFTDEEIAELSGLSIEEIKKLSAGEDIE